MKVRKLILSLLVAALVMTGITITATNGEPTARASVTQEIERISVDELKQMIQTTAPVTIIDVRSQSAYNAGHIRGAINIPLDQTGARIREIPASREIVTYCA